MKSRGLNGLAARTEKNGVPMTAIPRRKLPVSVPSLLFLLGCLCFTTATIINVVKEIMDERSRILGRAIRSDSVSPDADTTPAEEVP